MAILNRIRPAGADAPAGDMTPELTGLLMRRPSGEQRIGQKELDKGIGLLKKYKDGKANLELRIVQDEQWWELRHWEVIRSRQQREHPETRGPEPSSAWLFNAIVNKHADAMDNFPEPSVLPREKDDQESARVLTQVLPCVMEYNDFEQTYDDAWWEKLKHGTAAYGVFWDSQKENGLGDVEIRSIDLLNIFWEPGVTDIQKSRNLFIVDLVDNDLLAEMYPDHDRGKLCGSTIDVSQYVHDDNIDTTDKSVVVDWYYKLKAPDGRTLLHYVKFAGSELLYASENDEQYADVGWYADGEYPVVFDTLYPEKGTPVGFGYVTVCRDPQLYIDKLSGNILENSMMGTKKRYFASRSTNINLEQFKDWQQPIVEVDGELDDRRLKEIEVRPLDSIYVSVLNQKIDEMKDTASNRDVNSGGTGGGITAAAAIAALQEAGNKTSRDMIGSSYRAYSRICAMVVERFRQFYDAIRTFRITGQTPGSYEFIEISNAGLVDQPIGTDSAQETMFRRPVFDIKIKAQKQNPFSTMAQNELAKELYGLGVFNPERAQETLPMLEMMQFEGIDTVKDQVQQGQTLLNVCQQLKAQCDQFAAMLGLVPAGAQSGGTAPTVAASPAIDGAPGRGSIGGAVMDAATPMTGYGERLAKRSAPDMSAR